MTWPTVMLTRHAIERCALRMGIGRHEAKKLLKKHGPNSVYMPELRTSDVKDGDIWYMPDHNMLLVLVKNDGRHVRGAQAEYVIATVLWNLLDWKAA